MSHHYEEDPLFADEVYYEDEYQDDDAWFEDHYMGGAWYVHKAQNGQLYAVEVSLWQGDTTDAISSTQERCSLRDLTPAGRAACIRVGKSLKPGKSAEVDITEADEEAAEDDDYLFF